MTRTLSAVTLRSVLTAALLAALAYLPSDARAQSGTDNMPSHVCQGASRPLVSQQGTTGVYDRYTCATSLTGLTSLSADTVTGTTSVTVGSSGTALTQVKTYAENIAPASVAANTCATQTFTVTGIAATDFILFRATPTTPAITRVRPSGANTVAVEFCNPGNSAITPVGFTLNLIATSI